MSLKGIEHYKASHHDHHKGPSFDIKHQLMLSVPYSFCQN